tara:strand:- start:856 stop:2409 length:1554 start_codon:yes stop_codon:yes gene_type:complete
MVNADFDLYIIGGGINGCGIARDAVGRGYTVALCEMGDIASGTSSGSTKLIHGGLRYLEHFDFLLVRKALKEREILWANAPHIIWPLRFVLPHHKGLRPAWLLRLGLFIYDHMGGRRKLPATTTLNLRQALPGTSLKETYRKAFEYSDCWVNDSRLVVLNAMDAAGRGALIEPRMKCIGIEQSGDVWRITLQDMVRHTTQVRTARMIINAAGPWVDQIINMATHTAASHNIRLVQGSHIVVPKLYDHDRCYMFQNADDRIVFVIPYEGEYTLIGTTDRDYDGDPGKVKITPEEIAYLCRAASEYLKTPVQESDVIWDYAAVRPLVDDGASKAQEATRDYLLHWHGREDDLPFLNIFGGKITTYRRLAEAVMEKAQERLGQKGDTWTIDAPLPGGDFPMQGFQQLVDRLHKRYPFIAAVQLRRLARAYGTRLYDLLGNVATDADLGEDFGNGLREIEVRYLISHEWARTAEDILWRRSKLGIGQTPKRVQALERWIKVNVPFNPPASEARRAESPPPR